MKQGLFITELGLIPAASAFEPTKMETTLLTRSHHRLK